jgi:Anti-sigma factor NepR
MDQDIGSAIEWALTDQIGRHLRRLHEDVLRQPVPGRFLELVRQLESASSALPAHVADYPDDAGI